MTSAAENSETADRVTRPEPQRDGPVRNAWTAAPAAPPAPEGAADEVGQIVADAVRVGYQVIGENLRQGRAAADRYSAGAYGVGDVPEDLTQLGGRLVRASRELGTVWFDLIGAVLRDPGIREAFRRQAPPPAPTPAKPAVHEVTLTCLFRGQAKATAEPVKLRQPPIPSIPVIAGLHSPDPSLPAITGIAFTAATDGSGLVAIVTPADDQPAGTYSGVVCDEASHSPLGTLTVKVGT